MNDPIYETEYGGIRHEQLTTAFLRDSDWLRYATRPFQHTNIDEADLIQEANMSWLDVARRKNPYTDQRGFRAYAKPFIRSNLLSFAMANNRIVSVPFKRRYTSLITSLGKIPAESLYQSRSDAYARLSEKFNVPRREVEFWAAFVAGDDMAPDDCSPEDFSDPLDPITVLSWSETAGHQQECIDQVQNLPERQKEVITRRWLDDDPLTLSDIARDMDITPQRAWQLEKRGLTNLSDMITTTRAATWNTSDDVGSSPNKLRI